MAIAITRETQAITFADSPQFVTAQSDGVTGLASYFRLDLYVWSGLAASPPVSPTRTLQIPSIPTTGNASYADFEISSFLLAELDLDTIPTTYNGDTAKWFYYDIATDADLNNPESDVCLATCGVGTYREGVNPGTTISAENGKVFGTMSSKLTMSDSLDYKIPIYVGGISQNEEIQSNLGDLDLVVDFGLTLNSTDSAEQIAFVDIGATTYGIGWDNGTKFTFEINNALSTISKGLYNVDIECGNRPKKLSYYNASGAYVEFPINGIDRESVNVSKQTYQNLQPFYSNSDHVTQTYRSNGETVIELFTGWLDEVAATQITELLTSKYVWYEFEGEVYPCTILTQSIRFINRTYDKQIGYDLSIRIANPLLNKAR